MSEQQQYMLMFTLGPVQPFIAQARKTRDLWIGSFLLSKLMEAAMKDIDGTFVFPGKRTIKGDIPDLPNKYVALFDSRDLAEKAATQSEIQLAKCWYAICKEVRDHLLKGYDAAEVQAIWERQTAVPQLFEIYWVVVPDSGKGYGDWIQEAASLLDARKRLRDFLPQEEPGEKSTLSGEREALRDKGTSRKDVQNFWRRLTYRGQYSAKDIKKDGSERLDAIDSIKRFAFYSEHLKPGLGMTVYPSTSSVAAARFVEALLQVNNEQLNEPLKNWQQLTGKYHMGLEHPNTLPYLEQRAGDDKKWILRLDGDCFFSEAFTPRYLKENYSLTPDPEEQRRERESGLHLTLIEENFIPQCLATLKDLYKAAETQPTPYYALVQMDGDHMGTILSAVSSPEQHGDISKALSKFAREHAPEIVQETHPGRLVYAGGDDVLAFSPLEDILNMVDTLQQRYKETVMPKAPTASQENVTASIGIAIGHHFTPLATVRRAALEAEKLAKDRYGRNALVVTLMRRSGEQTRVGCHWRYDELDEAGQPIKLFLDFYQLLKKDVLSPKCVYILLEEAPALVKMEIEEPADPKGPASAMQSEIKRVLKRQRDPKKEKNFPDSEVDQYAWYLTRLAAAMDADKYPLRDGELETVELHGDKRRYGLVEVLCWLLVMAFLARKEPE